MLDAPMGVGMRGWGTRGGTREDCCLSLCCLVTKFKVSSVSNAGPPGTRKEFRKCSSNGLTLATRGGGFATAPTNHCKPVGIGNRTVYPGSVHCSRSNQSTHGINSPGLLLLRSGDFKKRLEQKSCTASRPEAGRSFHHEGNVRFAQEGQFWLKHFTWTCGGVKEGERIGLVFLNSI